MSIIQLKETMDGGDLPRVRIAGSAAEDAVLPAFILIDLKVVRRGLSDPIPLVHGDPTLRLCGTAAWSPRSCAASGLAVPSNPINIW